MSETLNIQTGQQATTDDGLVGKVVSVMNGIIGIKQEDGNVIYRYERQIASTENTAE